MPAVAEAQEVYVRLAPVVFLGPVEIGSVVHSRDGIGIIVSDPDEAGKQAMMVLSGDEFRADHHAAIRVLRKAGKMYADDPREEFSVQV